MAHYSGATSKSCYPIILSFLGYIHLTTIWLGQSFGYQIIFWNIVITSNVFLIEKHNLRHLDKCSTCVVYLEEVTSSLTSAISTLKKLRVCLWRRLSCLSLETLYDINKYSKYLHFSKSTFKKKILCWYRLRDNFSRPAIKWHKMFRAYVGLNSWNFSIRFLPSLTHSLISIQKCQYSRFSTETFSLIRQT